MPVTYVVLLLLITTSGRPVQRMRTLCNDLRRVIPKAIRINRGKLSIKGISEKALEIGADRIIIVERRKGGPGRIKFCTVPIHSGDCFTYFLSGVKTQDDIGRRTTVCEGLIVTVEKNASTSVRRLANHFSKFLNVSMLEETMNPAFKASAHFSRFRGNEVKISFTMPPIIKEVGPTLILRHTTDSHPGARRL